MWNEWWNFKEFEDKYVFFYIVDCEEVWIVKLIIFFMVCDVVFVKLSECFVFLYKFCYKWKYRII